MDPLLLIFLLGATILSLYLIAKNELYFLAVIAVLIIIGQLARIPLPFTFNGVLVSDLLIPISVVFWFCKEYYQKRTLPKTFLGKWIMLFLATAILSLIFAIPALPLKELLTSVFYLIRLITYFCLFFIAHHALTTHKHGSTYFLYGLYFITFLVGIAGLIQLKFVPDFTFMAVHGWDPHIGRLLSTWFDPNHVAGIFAFTIGFSFLHWYFEKKERTRLLLPALTVLTIIVLGLTFSRSGMLALLVIIGIIGVLRVRIVLLVGVLLLTLALTTNERLAERTMGLIDSSMALVTGSLEYDLDITSQKRVESWEQSFELMTDSYLFGLGYNTITFRKLDKGFVTNTSVHSASGSDSTLLNIFLTTGIVGLFFFLALLYKVLSISWILFLKGEKAFQKTLGLGMFAGMFGIVVHSFFVNTLLHPLFLLTLIPMWALIDFEYLRLQSESTTS